MGQVRKLPIICLNILIPLLRCKIFYLLFAGPVFLFVCVLLLFYLLHIPFLLLLTLSHVQFFATLWTLAYQSSLSFTISHSLLKPMSIESVMPSNHLILCHLLLLLLLIFPSIRVFSKESVLCIRWPKYWNFSFNISPSNEYSGLISFRMGWLNLFEVHERSQTVEHNWVTEHAHKDFRFKSVSFKNIFLFILEADLICYFHI